MQNKKQNYSKGAVWQILETLMLVIKANIGWFLVKALFTFLVEVGEMPIAQHMTQVRVIYWASVTLLAMGPFCSAIRYFTANAMAESQKVTLDEEDDEDDAPYTRRARERVRHSDDQY